MEPKAAGLLQKFEGMKAHTREIYNTLSEFENARVKASSLPDWDRIAEIEKLEKQKIKEVQMILDEYNNCRTEVHGILKISIPYFSPPNSLGEAKGVLRQVSIECDGVIGALRSLLTPISPEDADKLNKLRAEIAEVTIIHVAFRPAFPLYLLAGF